MKLRTAKMEVMDSKILNPLCEQREYAAGVVLDLNCSSALVNPNQFIIHNTRSLL